MDIKEKIQYYRDTLSLRTIKSEYIKLSNLEQEVRRHIKKVIKQKGCVHFSSNDLKGLANTLDKTLKAINKKIGFSNLLEIIEKEQNITVDVFNKSMSETVEYMAIARELQQVYSLVNYLAVVLNLLEIQYHQEQDEDSAQFSEELTNAIKDFLKGV